MTRVFRFAGLGLAVLFSTILASASDKSDKSTDVSATVIAHLPLPHSTGSQMLLQKQNGKHYLYVQQAGQKGFMVVDVTKPEMPALLRRTAEPNQATSGNLDMVAPGVAIAEAPEKTPTTLTSANRPTETVRLLDLSDPHNPKTMETFDKVTSILPDGGHGLIYLTNDEGLYILRYTHPSRFEPAKNKPPCDSEAEIQAMPPECQ
jgi:hypothetical protein